MEIRLRNFWWNRKAWKHRCLGIVSAGSRLLLPKLRGRKRRGIMQSPSTKTRLSSCSVINLRYRSKLFCSRCGNNGSRSRHIPSRSWVAGRGRPALHHPEKQTFYRNGESLCHPKSKGWWGIGTRGASSPQALKRGTSLKNFTARVNSCPSQGGAKWEHRHALPKVTRNRSKDMPFPRRREMGAQTCPSPRGREIGAKTCPSQGDAKWEQSHALPKVTRNGSKDMPFPKA